MQLTSCTRHYFVDEAGDTTLFDAMGQVIAGTEGCSSYFLLGVLDIADPDALGSELFALRTSLLADPYFKKVPSMQPAAKKTALAFHAKDDVAEVRREVFALLRRHELRFFAAVRNKHKVVEYVRQRNERDRPTATIPTSYTTTWCDACSRTCCTRTAVTTSTSPNGARKTEQPLCTPLWRVRESDCSRRGEYAAQRRSTFTRVSTTHKKSR